MCICMVQTLVNINQVSNQCNGKTYQLGYGQLIIGSHHQIIQVEVDNLKKKEDVDIDHAWWFHQGITPSRDYSKIPVSIPENQSNLSSLFYRDDWLEQVKEYTPEETLVEESPGLSPLAHTYSSNPQAATTNFQLQYWGVSLPVHQLGSQSGFTSVRPCLVIYQEWQSGVNDRVVWPLLQVSRDQNQTMNRNRWNRFAMRQYLITLIFLISFMRNPPSFLHLQLYIYNLENPIPAIIHCHHVKLYYGRNPLHSFLLSSAWGIETAFNQSIYCAFSKKGIIAHQKLKKFLIDTSQETDLNALFFWYSHY